MNYDLVKKLKDAGFPLKIGEPRDFLIDGTPILLPALSELIEACGDYISLWKSHFDKRWHCAKGETGYEDTYVDNDGNEVFTGSTPEEAVAELWLELNKK